MEPSVELRELADLAPAPFVTLYLNTWTKEPAARERARLFLRRRVGRAIRAVDDPHVRHDLERVAAEARERIDRFESAPQAVAFFASGATGVFRAIELAVPVEDELVVGTTPALRQLAALTGRYERTLLVLVSAENARIIDVVMGKPDASVVVRGDDVDVHRAARLNHGWSQTHYQRQVRERIERHLREVALQVEMLADRLQPRQIVVAGATPTVERFLHELPERIRTRVLDVVSLLPDAPLIEVVRTTLEEMQGASERGDDGVKETIDQALGGGPAALGLDEVIEAAREKRLMRLLLAASFHVDGFRCRDCRTITKTEGVCAYCQGRLDAVELGDALVRETILQDGSVESLSHETALDRFGGIGARLRF